MQIIWPAFLGLLPGLLALSLQGPVFIQEPPSSVDFSNSTGTILGCSALGNPPPTVTWLDASNRELPTVIRYREILSNGSLFFPPFPPEEYNPEVHAASYRCRATNTVGSIVSRECKIRADVSQTYQLQVQNVFVVRGNSAVLKCSVPNFMKGLVVVSSWMKEDPVLGRTSIHPGGRFTITAGGALQIRDVQNEDGYTRFMCQAMHKLSGERRVSMPGQLIVTDPDGNTAPRIEQSVSSINVPVNTPVDLMCSARGFPPPSFRWYRESGLMQQEISLVSPFIRPMGNVLQLLRPQTSDSGRYICVANNPLGEDRRDVTLTVTAPLSAYIRPQQQMVDAGSVANMNCTIAGDAAGPLEVAWFKDGRPLNMGGRHTYTEGGKVLTIHGVARNDKGMYQCLVRGSEDNAQGSSELTLGAVAPELHGTFIAQTIQPGPSVSLRCAASGSPHPHITWLLDGAELGGSNGLVLNSFLASGGDVVSHLNITSARVHHGGLYTCLASNAAGTASHSAPLNVYGPPSARPPRNLTVVAGTDVYLRCPVAGFPISSVTWRQGDSSLPANPRQRVFSNGTLLIKNVEGSIDSGKYSCVVSNTQGQSAQSSLGLDIMKPPEIAPFQFPATLREGMRAQVSCSIISGDFPISISWKKDGAPLAPEPDVAEQQHQFFSNLLFMNLAARHSGQYTCIANNAAATANYTARLVVRVAPMWELEPKDTSVLYQHSVVLHCQASGFPHPTSTWMRSRGSASDEFVPLQPGPRQFIANNGSIVIHAADSSHQGHYMCQANNGIGPGLSKSIFLRVSVPAHFSQRAINQSAVAGESTVLVCPALGDAPLRVTWVSGPRSLSMGQMREVSTTGGGVAAELHLNALTRRDTGAYRCVASNEFGQDELTLHLNVKEPPESPTGVALQEATSRSITIGWSAPYSGHAAISHYVVQYREQHTTLPASISPPNSPESTWQNATVGSDVRNARVSGLRPATAYLLRVMAVNEVGLGAPSQPALLALTTQEAPSGPPVDVSAESSSPDSLQVRWKPPASTYSNGEILGYQVAYKEVSALGESPPQLRRVRGRNRLEINLSDLKQFTRYQITVRAFNQVGHGPSSPPLIVTTKQGVPESAPTNFRCKMQSSQSIWTRWDPPPVEKRNGIIEGYKVFYQLVSSYSIDLTSEVEVKKTTNLETSIHGLSYYGNYSLRVAAHTAVGDGVRSAPIFCTTDEDVPGPPEQIKAVSMTSESILVTWSRPARPNGIITRYHVYINAVQQSGPKEVIKEVVFGDRDPTFEARRLKEFTTYEFWITASTRVGEGQPSAKVTQSPVLRVPARIAGFSRKHVVNLGQAVSLSCINVGLPAPEKVWKLQGRTLSSSDSANLQIMPDNSLSVASVGTSDQGNYTCHVENIYGKDEIHYEVVVRVAPSIPTLNVLAAGSSSLTLQWRLTDDGGSPVTAFVIHYRKENAIEWQHHMVDADRRNYVLSKLACGTSYNVHISAINKVGKGKHSPTTSVSTKGSAPRAPTQEEFLEVNSTCVTLFLDSWPSGGCAINYFTVELREARQGVPWTLISSKISPDQGEVTLKDLHPSRWYSVRVGAQSDTGSAQQEYLFATRNSLEEIVMPDMEPQRPGSQHSVSFTDPTVIVPIISGLICTAAVAVCVCIVVRRRQYEGYQQSSSSSTSVTTAEQNRYLGKTLLMEMENKRNADQQHHRGQLYSPSPARKAADSSLSCHKGSDTTSAQDYEICPYATFSLNTAPPPPQNNGHQTMDYCMQFQTFSQQDCYAGQPNTSSLASAQTSSYKGGGGAANKEYYSRVRRKSNGRIMTNAGEATCLPKQISCISSQQTLPLSSTAGVSSSNGGRSRQSRHSPPPMGRPRSCAMADSADSQSDSSASRVNANFSSRSTYHLHSQKQDKMYERDSSTESAEASPEVTHRSRRCEGPTRRPSGGGALGQNPLQPPSGFSDSHELSEAECDRTERIPSTRPRVDSHQMPGLPLFRHEQLEQELVSLVKRYRNERDKEKQDYTIHV
ncbi:cell adhesion molecule Dscam2-like isoform X2 [Neocloeon triangulifer]|uniref:cell adhesion molecule Dscam2-like isoform X2 n=1 Tax=Neocloeon triangulifer TaxID=2078957 RepID=UPI00286F8865|nr:cell adhesion molecule Dscam2-like isoform X2 [Neocloeon triangulifer]